MGLGLTFLVETVASIAVHGNKRATSRAAAAVGPRELGIAGAIQSEIPHQTLNIAVIRARSSEG